MPPGGFEQFGRFIAIFTRDDVWVGVSHDLATLLGYEQSELIGQKADAIYEPMEPERRRRLRALLFSTGAVTDLCMLITKAGERIPYAFTARPVNGGEVYVTVGEPVPFDSLLPRPEDAWLTREEAAAYARTTTRTIDRAAADGRLRAGGTEGLRLFRRSWLDAWLGAVVFALLLALALACLFGVDFDLGGLFGLSHAAAPWT